MLIRIQLVWFLSSIGLSFGQTEERMYIRTYEVTISLLELLIPAILSYTKLF